MSRREAVAGVRVDDCSLKEALDHIGIYLKNDSLNIVETVNMKTIVAAGEDEEVRACLETMDLVIPGDKEILHEMGITSEERSQEIQDNLLYYETMERIRQERLSLFLLTETEAQRDQLAEELNGSYAEGDPVFICGSYALENGQGDMEDVVNAVNSVTPRVLLSVLSTPLQEHFLYQHRQMLNVKLWFGIGAESGIMSAGNTPGRLYRKFLVRQKMRRQIQSYETSEKEE